MPASKLPEILFQDDTLTACRAANLLIAAWRAAPTLSQMTVMGTQIARNHGLFGDDVGFVNLGIGGRADEFSRDVRVEANRLAARWRSACTANIVLLDGLDGVVARSLLRAMGIVGRTASPWKVFRSIDAASPWIASHLDGLVRLTWSSDDVRRILSDLASGSGERRSSGSVRIGEPRR